MSRGDKAGWYRKTEAVLYKHKFMEARIEVLEAEYEDMMPKATGSYVAFKGDGTSTPETSETEFFGIKRANSRVRRELIRLTTLNEALKAVRALLSEEERRLINNKYDQCKSDSYIWHCLGMSKRTFYYFKKDTVEKVAEGIGYKRIPGKK